MQRGKHFIFNARGDSVTIKNDIMKVWSIDDVDYFYNLAKENTQRMFRGTVQNMFEVLMGMPSNHLDDIDADVLDAMNKTAMHYHTYIF